MGAIELDPGEHEVRVEQDYAYPITRTILLEPGEQLELERHDGGSHWVGTGGNSPFGHSGNASTGIRIGVSSSGRLFYDPPPFDPSGRR